MKCVAVHTFAGGFAIGVQAAGGEILKCIEPLGFGVGTLRERLGLRVDTEGWRVPAGGVDMVFGNPRCGGFTSLGSNAAVLGESRGTGCRQTEDSLQLLDYGIKARAKVIVLESVPALFRSAVNAGVKRILVGILREAGYSVVHFLHASAIWGNAQRCRRRYFLVATRRGIHFGLIPVEPVQYQTLGKDILDGFANIVIKANETTMRKSADYTIGCYRKMPPHIEGMYQYLKQGDCAANLMHRHGPTWFKLRSEDTWRKAMNARSVIPFGCPGASHSMPRIKWNGPAPVLVGNSSVLIHPKKNRTLTVGELAAIMGWPEGVIPIGQDPVAQLAKGIVPHCGEFLTRCVMASLDGQFKDMKAKDLTYHSKGKYRGIRCTAAADPHERVFDILGAIPPIPPGAEATVWNSLTREPLFAANKARIEGRRGSDWCV